MEKHQKDKKLPNNLFDLPEERLASTDETGKRVYLYPALVKGTFRTLRNYSSALLVILFLVMPWLKIFGKPVILLDIFHRKFVILGFPFWAHDAPLLLLIFVSFVLTIGLLTALFGRFWCGALCPQTVFIDRIYRKIEDWIEGSPAQKRRLDAAPWTIKKISQRTLKWSLYLIASMIITHSFLAYFVGPEALFEMIQKSPSDHPLSFLVILITTGIILFDFGWFREQFCIIACPYGRLQSVLMDDHSLTVSYDYNRGEPRKQTPQDTKSTGDCINCYRCVQVCPTGIDIRRGVQMECIMCTACIDACNTVMAKIGKPKNLIRLDTEARLKGEKPKKLRPRVFIYAGLLIATQVILIWTLSTHSSVTHHVLRSKQPYQVIAKNTIINQFDVTLRNQSLKTVVIRLIPDSTIEKQGITWVFPEKDVVLKANEVSHHVLFIQFPASILVEGKATLRYTLDSENSDHKHTQQKNQEVTLVGPLL